MEVSDGRKPTVKEMLKPLNASKLARTLGVTRQAVSPWATGAVSIPPKRQVAVAAAIGVPLSVLAEAVALEAHARNDSPSVTV